jgi:hypothetical protein
MHRERAASPRAFDSLPFQDPNPGRCQLGRIIENQNSDYVTPYSCKAQLALWRDEDRILIFDDPAELEESQRP